MESGLPTFRQGFTCPALLKAQCQTVPVRDYHPLRCAFPNASGCLTLNTGLVPVRSPLLRESLLISFPQGTEMFQFPWFASTPYKFRCRYPYGWVAPFGHSGIKASWRLPQTYRSLARPSSPLCAKASTKCPSHTSKT